MSGLRPACCCYVLYVGVICRLRPACCCYVLHVVATSFKWGLRPLCRSYLSSTSFKWGLRPLSGDCVLHAVNRPWLMDYGSWTMAISLVTVHWSIRRFCTQEKKEGLRTKTKDLLLKQPPFSCSFGVGCISLCLRQRHKPLSLAFNGDV